MQRQNRRRVLLLNPNRNSHLKVIIDFWKRFAAEIALPQNFMRKNAGTKACPKLC
jgi:hypothetical protein